MEVFGIGAGELLLVLVLALIVLGPEKLPEVAGQMGRTIGDLRRQASQLTSEFQHSLGTAVEERREQRTAAALATGTFCPQCGGRTGEGARFCASCGASLSGPVIDGETRP